MNSLSLISDIQEQDYTLALQDAKVLKKGLGQLIGHMVRSEAEVWTIQHVKGEVLHLSPLYRAWTRLLFYAHNEGIEITPPKWYQEA